MHHSFDFEHFKIQASTARKVRIPSNVCSYCGDSLANAVYHLVNNSHSPVKIPPKLILHDEHMLETGAVMLNRVSVTTNLLVVTGFFGDLHKHMKWYNITWKDIEADSKHKTIPFSKFLAGIFFFVFLFFVRLTNKWELWLWWYV